MTKIFKERFIKELAAIKGTPKNERISTVWKALNRRTDLLMKYVVGVDKIQINLSGEYLVDGHVEDIHYEWDEDYITIFGGGFTLVFDLEEEEE